MGNSLVAFLSAQASITFPTTLTFILSWHKYFPFIFHLISAYVQHPLSKKCMLSIARGITFLSPIDISHRCKNLPDPVRGLWSCRSSTAKGLKVFKVCIDSSEHRGTLPPLFSHHAEGRDHQTEISTPQQAPGKAERRTCVSEGICTTKTPLF